MALQMARPYDTGEDALGTWGDIERLAAAQRQNRLGELDLQLQRQKAERSTQAYQAQQGLLGQIRDPQQRLAAIMAPDKFAASIFKDPKDRYMSTPHGLYDLQAPGGPKKIGGGGGYRLWNGQAIPGGGMGGGMGGGAGANLASAAPPGGGLDFRTARRRFEGGSSGSAPPNPNSSAQGPDQFIESTWERLMLTHGRGFIETKIGPNANLNDPKVKQAIQELRNDEEVSGAMAEIYGQENAKELQGAGIEPSTRNLVVAHFLGGSGAKRFLSANPNDPAANHADPAQVNANRSVFFDKDTGRARTVGEVLAEVDRRTGAVAGQASGQASGQAARSEDGSHLIPIIDEDTGKPDANFGYNPQTRQLERYPSRGNTVNVDVGGKKGTEAMVTMRAKRFEAIRDKGVVMARVLPKLDELEATLQQLSVQGPGAGTIVAALGTIQTAARAAGVPEATIKQYTEALTGMKHDDPANAAKANKLVSDLVTVTLRAAYAGLGSSSDREMAGIQAAQANTENPLEANLYLIRNLLRPQAQYDVGLWEQVMPLESDPELPSLHSTEWQYQKRWDQQHKQAAQQPPPQQQPPPDQPPPQQPPPVPPPPNQGTPNPAYSPERQAAIRQQYPQALVTPGGDFVIPNPDHNPAVPNSPKYLRIKP